MNNPVGKMTNAVKEAFKEESEAFDKEKSKNSKAAKGIAFDVEDYLEEITFEDKFGRLKTETVYKQGFNNHRGKCKLRAARHFGVSIEHLDKSYRALSGKKLDGIFCNDIIDRFGFSDGVQLNRTGLCEKYKLNPVNSRIDILEDKLIAIIQSKDINKAYSNYINDIKTEVTKNINDAAIYGE